MTSATDLRRENPVEVEVDPRLLTRCEGILESA
jgi:hypothetical protein